MTTAFITHTDCLSHEMQAGHPERPQRLHAIEDQLVGARLYDFLRYHEAPKATMEQLTRVHDSLYVEKLVAESPSAGLIRLDPDTWMCPHTLDAALRAAGANVLATNLVLANEVANAFCAVRPPGHHAMPGAATGFCLFNNIAVGVAHALHSGCVQRVGILDFDAHHGNGTEAIFKNDPRIMICSSYQDSLYPYSASVRDNENVINVALKPGTGGAQFRASIETQWLPRLESFKPQMLFISAGFDGHREDEISELNLTESDYSWVTQLAVETAERFAQGRIVSTLEGGYALSALGRSVSAHVKCLMRM